MGELDANAVTNPNSTILNGSRHMKERLFVQLSHHILPGQKFQKCPWIKEGMYHLPALSSCKWSPMKTVAILESSTTSSVIATLMWTQTPGNSLKTRTRYLSYSDIPWNRWMWNNNVDGSISKNFIVFSKMYLFRQLGASAVITASWDVYCMHSNCWNWTSSKLSSNMMSFRLRFKL